jgi:hypothetical protein
MAVVKILSIMALVAPCMASEAKPSWWKSITDKAKNAVASGSDLVDVQELLRTNPMVVESCGDATHAMHIESVHFDSANLKVIARGSLMREIQGGDVSALISLGKPAEGMTPAKKFLRDLAFKVAGHHRASEPLCSHMARTSAMACPLVRGTKEISFAFNRLPSAISAGTYQVKLTAVDEVEKPVACIKGHFHVPLGPNGESFRRLGGHVAATSSAAGQIVGFVALALLALAF